MGALVWPLNEHETLETTKDIVWVRYSAIRKKKLLDIDPMVLNGDIRKI